jgi:hypothetical protein
MSKHFHRAMVMLNAAKPASGFRPETPEEWQRLLRAQEEMGYAINRKAGMPDKQARELARQIHGGPGGMLLLQIAFKESSNE